MNAIPHGLPPILHAYLPPLLALAVALAGALACRARRAGPLLPAVGAAAMLAGWAALLPLSVATRALPAPRALPDYLLLPAAAAVLAGLAGPWLRGRWSVWLTVGLAVLAGWWLAGSPAGRGEFWRVWAAIVLLSLLLSRTMAGEAARALAAGLALWLGLVMAGAPPSWIVVALVAVAAALGLLAARPGAGTAGKAPSSKGALGKGALGKGAPGRALPAALLAAAMAGADLSAGRLVRGAVNAVDLVCLGAVLAPVLAAVLAPRLGRRLGAAGPVLAAIAAAALAVGGAWLAAKAMRR